MFTSSGSVHGKAELVTETTPTVEEDKLRRRLLLAAEDVVLRNANSYVLRLSGLYSLEHGPHWYWLTQNVTDIAVNADDSVNMIHYDDAAAAVVALLGLEKVPEQNVFLACAEDGTTMEDLLTSARMHSLYANTKIPTFTGESKTRRRYNNEFTRKTLMWEPRWSTMVQFMEHAAEEEQNKMNRA